MEKVLWQPHLDWKTDFYITLDENLARELIRARLPDGMQTRFNQMMSQRLQEKHGIKTPTPCTFYEDTAFIRGFYLTGKGDWLSTDCYTYQRLLQEEPTNKPVRYDTHNTDHTHQTIALLHLFDNWIDYSRTLIDMKDKK